MVGFVNFILTNRGNISGCDASADLCKNPQCDKDPDFAFILGQPGRRKPSVRKTGITREEQKIV
jgi:hypothetical protein